MFLDDKLARVAIDTPPFLASSPYDRLIIFDDGDSAKVFRESDAGFGRFAGWGFKSLVSTCSYCISDLLKYNPTISPGSVGVTSDSQLKSSNIVTEYIRYSYDKISREK